MVRGGGRGYRGGRGGSSYRGSGSSSYRGSSGRSSFGNSYNSARGSSYHYDRSKDRGRDRRDDHKRSYRNSSRDRSPDRKRSRHEDSRLSSSYSSSYRRNDSSRSRQTPPPPSVRSSAPHRREESSSSHRHSGANDSMGPPKSLPPRSRIIRRGGGSSHRSSGGGGRSSVRIVRRGRESTDLRIMRKKLLLAQQRDRARRIKIARLTSSLRTKRRDGPTRKPTRKVRDKKDDESKKGEDDDEDTDADKSKSKNDGEDDEEEADEKDEEGKVKKESKEKGDEAEGSDAEEDEEEKEDNEEKDDDEKSKKGSRRPLKRGFIKLTCVHCRAKCLTFKEYSNHLYSRSHKLAMRRLALRQKAQLAQMRLNQRNAQRDIEESSKDETEDCKPQYCPLCRLNYRQQKAKHQLSEAHRNMKKFLMPYCATCHIAYKSPMVYETHRCSLDHIKRKARNNESANSESSDGEKEVDLKDFLTVDSVGEVDIEEGAVKGEGEDGKEKVNVGAEHVKKIETLYCDLCRYHIPLKEEEEAVVRKHCATRGHLKAFVRFKEDESIRLETEKLQRKQKELREKKKKEKESAEKNEEGKEAENGDENEGTEDKIWEDVDKDLGDLLRDVGPSGDHEDDEEDGSVLDINIERFDRFKNSETQKKEVNGDAEEEPDVVEVAEDGDSAPPTPVKGKEKSDKKSDAAKTEEKTAVEAK